MVSPQPWKIEMGSGRIYDNDGELIYETGTGFTHTDDEEFVMNLLEEFQRSARRFVRET